MRLAELFLRQSAAMESLQDGLPFFCATMDIAFLFHMSLLLYLAGELYAGIEFG